MNKTDIQNLALALIGAKKIVSEDDATKAARLTKTTWNVIYKSTLELPHDWVFATTYSNITGNLTTSPTIGEYDYRYRLPTKCLRVIAQVDVDDIEVEYKHRIENYIDANNKSYRTLLTTESTCYIKYIYDLGQPNEIAQWPAWFANLVAIRLAIALCEPLKQDKQKKNQLLVMYTEPVTGWLAEAIKGNAAYNQEVQADGTDITEGNKDVLEASGPDVTRVRYIVERS